MEFMYANDYTQIPTALAHNQALARRTIALIDSQPIPAKALEGPGRMERFREILRELALGRLNQFQAIRRTSQKLSRHQSPHASSNHVFATGWDERLIRTQLSRFYNQAVLEELAELGASRCFVPHSSAEDPATPCSRELAGRTHEVENLLSLLVKSYAQAHWSQDPKIPNHPHCTHVVRPV